MNLMNKNKIKSQEFSCCVSYIRSAFSTEFLRVKQIILYTKMNNVSNSLTKLLQKQHISNV